MNWADNIGIAQQLLAGIRDQRDPEVVAALFSEHVLFEVPGDDGEITRFQMLEDSFATARAAGA
jgi:hypothetical protein